ncbi:MAG TPA: BamA/TamA family outer membrane protein, partial [Puia sp.]|nr:BamA/TamA family outer membrane protein [Puia sp.]
MLRKALMMALPVFLALFTVAQTPMQDENYRSRDILDIVHRIFGKSNKSQDSSFQKRRIHIGVLPAVGYTLQTGFAAVVSANMIIYNKHKRDTILPSTYLASLSITQYKQVILPFQSVIYFNRNRAMLISDWRYLKYPSSTWGLGMHTSPSDENPLDFQYFKLHESILFQIVPGIYAGGGFAVDYFWNIKELNPHPFPPTDLEKYGFDTRTISSGVSFHVLRDTRDNPINPYSGTYASINVTPRFKFMGSDAAWTAMIAQWRGYYRVPASSTNVLALWSFNWLTLSGKPPYLMLPSTAWDKSYNTGRGYIQGRFRSNNMLDGEAEYRIQLTRNGLLGMVLFGNLQSFSEIDTWRFEGIAPAGGVGLRLKLNKYSRT